MSPQKQYLYTQNVKNSILRQKANPRPQVLTEVGSPPPDDPNTKLSGVSDFNYGREIGTEYVHWTKDHVIDYVVENPDRARFVDNDFYFNYEPGGSSSSWVLIPETEIKAVIRHAITNSGQIVNEVGYEPDVSLIPLRVRHGVGHPVYEVGQQVLPPTSHVLPPTSHVPAPPIGLPAVFYAPLFGAALLLRYAIGG